VKDRQKLDLHVSKTGKLTAIAALPDFHSSPDAVDLAGYRMARSRLDLEEVSDRSQNVPQNRSIIIVERTVPVNGGLADGK
jgi:hypothetical protein